MLTFSAVFQDVIEVLSKYSADVDRPVSISKAKATPLMLAAANGHLKTCMALVDVSDFCFIPKWMATSQIQLAIFYKSYNLV